MSLHVLAVARRRRRALLTAAALAATLLTAGPLGSVAARPVPVLDGGLLEDRGPDGPASAGPAVRGAPRPPGGVALTWSAEYMNDDHVFTAAQARRMARRFDLVAAMPAAFGQHTALMRRANPDLTLLTYTNATMAEPEAARRLPEAAYAHDDAGRRIRAIGWGTWLMEPSHPAWRRTAVAQCDDRVALSGYDGCLVDMLTLGVFARGIVTATPRDPSTGQDYTEVAYRREMADLAAAYRRASPGLVHVGNSVENAYRYWRSPDASSRPLVGGQPGAQMEDFLRGAGDGVDDFPSAADWRRNVRVVTDMEARGTTGLFTTKLWTPADRAAVARWQAYATASFLMGAGGRSYFSFTPSRDQAGVLQRTVPYRMPRSLGRPTSEMTRVADGAWVRRFARGRAVVNPTPRAVTVPLGSRWRTLDGRVVTSLRLGPHTGDVLVLPRP